MKRVDLPDPFGLIRKRDHRVRDITIESLIAREKAIKEESAIIASTSESSSSSSSPSSESSSSSSLTGFTPWFPESEKATKARFGRALAKGLADKKRRMT